MDGSLTVDVSFRLRKCTKRLTLPFVRTQSTKRSLPKKSRRRGEKY